MTILALWNLVVAVFSKPQGKVKFFNSFDELYFAFELLFKYVFIKENYYVFMITSLTSEINQNVIP